MLRLVLLLSVVSTSILANKYFYHLPQSMNYPWHEGHVVGSKVKLPWGSKNGLKVSESAIIGKDEMRINKILGKPEYRHYYRPLLQLRAIIVTPYNSYWEITHDYYKANKKELWGRQLNNQHNYVMWSQSAWSVGRIEAPVCRLKVIADQTIENHILNRRILNEEFTTERKYTTQPLYKVKNNDDIFNSKKLTSCFRLVDYYKADEKSSETPVYLSPSKEVFQSNWKKQQFRKAYQKTRDEYKDGIVVDVNEKEADSIYQNLHERMNEAENLEKEDSGRTKTSYEFLENRWSLKLSDEELAAVMVHESVDQEIRRQEKTLPAAFFAKLFASFGTNYIDNAKEATEGERVDNQILDLSVELFLFRNIRMFNSFTIEIGGRSEKDHTQAKTKVAQLEASSGAISVNYYFEDRGYLNSTSNIFMGLGFRAGNSYLGTTTGTFEEGNYTFTSPFLKLGFNYNLGRWGVRSLVEYENANFNNVEIQSTENNLPEQFVQSGLKLTLGISRFF
jgi:hypothetical protein